MITEGLKSMAQDQDPDQIESKRKALTALFPYAVRWEQGGDNRMFNAYSDTLMVPKARELVVEPIVMLLDEASPNSPNWVVTLMLPYTEWGWSLKHRQHAVTRWAGAVSTVPYTEELGQNVVDTLLQIASEPHLQPYIPVQIWLWLKKQPSLPPKCRGRSLGTMGQVLRRVRELGDVELLESYFLLVWSEWDIVCDLDEMHTSIREDFGGIGMWRHREVLIKQLDCVLRQLDQGPKHLTQHNLSLDEWYITTAKKRYGKPKEELLKVDREALEILTGNTFKVITMFNLLTSVWMSTESHSIFICALPLLCL